MRPSIQTVVGGAGVPINGTWIPLSYNAQDFNCIVAGLAVGVATPTFTWSAQFTLDDPVFERPVTASQTTTVITVTDQGGSAYGGFLFGPGGNTGHGLAVGDSVTLKGTGGIDGVYDVTTVVSATQYTLTSLVSQSFTAATGTRVTPLRVLTHAGLSGITAATAPRVFANLGDGQPGASATATAVSPCIATAIRPRMTAWTSGNLDFIVMQGLGS